MGGGRQGGEQPLSTHTFLLLRIQFLYARCNSQQAQLVSVVALEMLLFPPHGGRDQSDRLFSSSVFLFSLFSSALSLSRAFLSRRSAAVQVTSGNIARVEETPLNPFEA
jgi:hypothetical protein